MIKTTVYGWVIWIGGLVALFAIDYSIRMSQNNLHFGGIPEPILFFLEGLLALAALYLLFLGAKNLKLWLRLLAVVTQGAVGFCIWVFMSLMYVCSAGIDCL